MSVSPAPLPCTIRCTLLLSSAMPMRTSPAYDNPTSMDRNSCWVIGMCAAVPVPPPCCLRAMSSSNAVAHAALTLATCASCTRSSPVSHRTGLCMRPAMYMCCQVCRSCCRVSKLTTPYLSRRSWGSMCATRVLKYTGASRRVHALWICVVWGMRVAWRRRRTVCGHRPYRMCTAPCAKERVVVAMACNILCCVWVMRQHYMTTTVQWSYLLVPCYGMFHGKDDIQHGLLCTILIKPRLIKHTRSISKRNSNTRWKGCQQWHLFDHPKTAWFSSYTVIASL